MTDHFAISAPQLLAIGASRPTGDEGIDESVHWFVSFSKDYLPSSDGARIMSVIGGLRVTSPDGTGNVTVGALMRVLDEPPAETFEDAVRNSDATETLYDIARGHLLPALRSVACDAVLDHKSPVADVYEFVSDEDDE